MKKLFAVILPLALGCRVLACCGPPLNVVDDDYDVNLDVDYETTGTLKIGITTIYTERWLIDALIKEYNQVYPNVTVTVDEVQDAYNNTLVGYWQAEQKTPGIMPDILVSNSADMHPIIENGILLNLQKYIDESVKAGLLDLGDFVADYWKLGQKGFDGDQYVIPRSADRVVTALNETRFNEVFAETPDEELPFRPIPGKKIPANGWTWQEFLDTCAAIRKWYDENSRAEEFLLDSYFDWEAVYNAVFRSRGVELIDEDGTVQIDTPAVKSAMDFMSECIEKRYVAPLGGSVQAGYNAGQGCMLFNSAYAQRFYTELTDQGYLYNVTTFPLVTGKLETSYIGSGVGGYGIASTSKNRDLAWTFLRFLLTKDGQNALAGGGMTTMPIRKDMSDPDANAWGALQAKGVNMAAYTYGTERCVTTDFFLRCGKPGIYSDILESVNNMLNTGLGLDDKAMSAIIKDCQEEVEYIISTGR